MAMLAESAAGRLEQFRMERYQSRYWHRVEFDLSESGVRPLRIRELLDGEALDLLEQPLGYPLSEGSLPTREAVAAFYPGATADNVTIVNGGSEANLLTLWSLLEPGTRLACMVPNYMQGFGLGRHLGAGSDAFYLRSGVDGWRLDVPSLEAAVGPSTRAVLVCNPNNPTGAVLSEAEMDAVVRLAARAGAWIVCDEIYRGAEIDSERLTPSFWGRYDRVAVTGGLSKAFAMPGLRCGWIVAPPPLLEAIWERHDYTTLTPGILSDRLAAHALRGDVRDRLLARTRGILRENLPALEAWVAAHPFLRYERPRAGAIAYAEYDLPIESGALVERIRKEQSVLLVPGEMFGLGKGLRFGTGYDMAHTLAGLARVDATLEAVARAR